MFQVQPSQSKAWKRSHACLTRDVSPSGTLLHSSLHNLSWSTGAVAYGSLMAFMNSKLDVLEAEVATPKALQFRVRQRPRTSYKLGQVIDVLPRPSWGGFSLHGFDRAEEQQPLHDRAPMHALARRTGARHRGRALERWRLRLVSGGPLLGRTLAPA